MTELDAVTEKLNGAIEDFVALLREKEITSAASVEVNGFHLSWCKHNGVFDLHLRTGSRLLDCSREMRVQGARLIAPLFQKILDAGKREFAETESACEEVRTLVKRAKTLLTETDEIGKTFQKPSAERQSRNAPHDERGREPK